MNEDLSVFFGYLALLFFIAANLYTLAKWVIKNKIIADTQVLKEKLGMLFNIHVQCNVLMFVCAFIHGLTADQSNFLLVLAMVIFGWLIVGGAVMKSGKDLNSPWIKHVQVLHAQQGLFGLAIVLLIIGHIIAG